MILLTVDRDYFQALDTKERSRIKGELELMGVRLADCREAYTDESGKVVGAIRMRRDMAGNLVFAGLDEVATDQVGLVP